MRQWCRGYSKRLREAWTTDLIHKEPQVCCVLIKVLISSAPPSIFYSSLPPLFSERNRGRDYSVWVLV